MQSGEYTQEFRVEQGVMHVRLAGVFPKALLRKDENVFQPLVEACEKSNCRVAVVDARDLQIEFGILEMFRAGVDAASLSRSGLRLALVARAEIVDPFFDVVVTNRFARVEVFTDMEDAMKWLSRS